MGQNQLLIDLEIGLRWLGEPAVERARPLITTEPRATGWTPHRGQEPPDDARRVWMILAGRGFGKTRAGAEWIMGLVRRGEPLRIALVGATLDEVDRVMIRGVSGLLAVAAPDEELAWIPSRRSLLLPAGCEAYAYSGEKPDLLRGPEHHVAWVDELAKYAWPQETWDNLMLGLRLGGAAAAGPRVLVTTTPRPIALLTRLADDPHTFVARGRTDDNPHLPPAFVADVRERFAGTRLARQELDGEIVEDVEGALWTRELVEKCRMAHNPHPNPSPEGEGLARRPSPEREGLVRIVIGVDPPGSADGDACGIVAVGLGEDGIGYVIGDHSLRGASPERWAQAVAGAAAAHGADRVVAEANQGGAMVRSVLHAADCRLPVKLVHARQGKAARAEPVAALFEGGKARFAGAFPELEDELCALRPGGDYAGPGRSPDRADAMVWAFHELMLARRIEPAVRAL